VRDNPDLPWNWRELSKNKCMTLEVVRNNPDLPLNLVEINILPWKWWKIILICFGIV
jgi:hypothetical protein